MLLQWRQNVRPTLLSGKCPITWIESYAVAIHVSSEASRSSWPRSILGCLFSSHIAVQHCSRSGYWTLWIIEIGTCIYIFTVQEHHIWSTLTACLFKPSDKKTEPLMELTNKWLLWKLENWRKWGTPLGFYNTITFQLYTDKSIFKVIQNKYVNQSLSYSGLFNGPLVRKTFLDNYTRDTFSQRYPENI